LRFFTDTNHKLGIAHAEYAQYWRENAAGLPCLALQLSGGMLPVELFTEVTNPIYLHDARIAATSIDRNDFAMKLHCDDNGGLRIIDIVYDCTGHETPNIEPELLADQPGSDLMCHEFEVHDDWLEHRMLFANSAQLSIQFNRLTVA